MKCGYCNFTINSNESEVFTDGFKVIHKKCYEKAYGPSGLIKKAGVNRIITLIRVNKRDMVRDSLANLGYELLAKEY